MKILLFKGTQLEPIKIYHDPNDVTICKNGMIAINETGNEGLYEFIDLQTVWVECHDSDQRELCLLLFLEEQLQ